MSETVMRRTQFGARVDGVNVVVLIGNRPFTMDYDTANRLAVVIRGCAKKAKSVAGDTSVKVFGFADLTDGTLEQLKAQRSRDGTAVFLRR